MPAQWTGEVIRDMHLARITKREVAKEMGVEPAYVSMILNGKREPKGAEARLREAVQRVKERRVKA